ncbi:NodT family efflux transporter outer membrane factor (OMF) lipoprotein [Herbaspirillum sp. Sphag1AN]|uniref:efflux transporter outer membrane subunit n=1 Tax=unclassified Herbaspirillum TaxID=2624150 RepID=UPI00161FA695|nr:MULTISPECIES: efflux transporter outer membrane subunit [unclassified Herbaspirillum]MBB3211831.1 NodT family efflux transporter outer membrane factor (OMF) lipoprotein [Herbaspirillum sp. Sphag1AN]MBB3244335.1 NodT family efflux transporter outer membrane factor (OMF) lipoprotein [Herbaspirillum sp. Sphag64]
MFSSRILGPVLFASLAAGCAVGPDYQRPASPLTDHYIGQQSLAQGDTLAPKDVVAWWNEFGDPLLARYVSLALEQNLDLVQASARVRQARAGLSAANAALLPSGTVTSSAARAHQSIETPIGSLLNATPDYKRWGDAYETDLGASWEIDVFGGLRRGKEAAQAEYQASRADVAATRLVVAAQTADTYIAIRGLQQRLDIAHRQVKTQQELLTKVQLLYTRGLAAQYQVDQTEGALAQVEASVPMLQAALAAAMNALDVMLGTPPGTHRQELADARGIPVAPKITDMGSPAELLQRRPDLIVAERRVAAANARIGQAIAEYYPHFSLSGLLGSATTLPASNLFASGASQAQGVLGLRWRLFDFGRINAQIDQAHGQEAEALASYRLAVLHAAEDVENTFSALINTQTQTAALVRGEGSLSHARQTSFIAYEHGTASLIDVLHADETLLRAADARAQAQTDLARAAVATYKALGGGWDPQAEVDTLVAQKGD